MTQPACSQDLDCLCMALQVAWAWQRVSLQGTWALLLLVRLVVPNDSFCARAEWHVP